MIPHIRTADDRFEGLPDHPWAPRYTDALPGLDGLRLAYLDEGPQDAALTWLCLHGNPSWSYLYRKMIPVFLAAGHRVVAPDLIGFGRSDKPLDAAVHRFGFHRRILLEFVEHLDLQRVALVVQDWGGLFGLTMPMEAPQRYAALLVMNTALATGDAPLTPGFIACATWCDRSPTTMSHGSSRAASPVSPPRSALRMRRRSRARRIVLRCACSRTSCPSGPTTKARTSRGGREIGGAASGVAAA